MLIHIGPLSELPKKIAQAVEAKLTETESLIKEAEVEFIEPPKERVIEIIKEVERIVEVIKEVPVEVEKIVDREVIVIKEIPVEVIREVEKPVEIIKQVEVQVEKIIKQVPYWCWLIIGLETIALIVSIIR